MVTIKKKNNRGNDGPLPLVRQENYDGYYTYKVIEYLNSSESAAKRVISKTTWEDNGYSSIRTFEDALIDELAKGSSSFSFEIVNHIIRTEVNLFQVEDYLSKCYPDHMDRVVGFQTKKRR